MGHVPKFMSRADFDAMIARGKYLREYSGSSTGPMRGPAAAVRTRPPTTAAGRGKERLPASRREAVDPRAWAAWRVNCRKRCRDQRHPVDRFTMSRVAGVLEGALFGLVREGWSAFLLGGPGHDADS